MNKTPRYSNFELLRIIAMLMIVLVHANYTSIGAPNRDSLVLEPFVSFLRIFSEQICIVGVNVFVLISGWFGIKPSAKGLSSILFQVFFWGCVVFLVGLGLKINIPVGDTAKVFWFGGYYWFVVAYVVLYLLSPVLNIFIDQASSRQFLAVLICLLVAEFVYGWVINSEMFNQGYSVISFVVLYLLARFIRLYSSKFQSAKAYVHIISYGLFTLIPTFISYFGVLNGGMKLHPVYYSSPFVILASVSLLLFFSKIRFDSKLINWIACSTFSVYLIHFHPIVFPYFMRVIQHLTGSLPLLLCSCAVLALSIGILLICVIFDKIRLGCWQLLYSSCFNRLFRNLEESYNRILVKLGL